MIPDRFMSILWFVHRGFLFLRIFNPMRNIPGNILFIMLSLITFTGCRSDKNAANTTTADVISYKVNYLEEMAGDIPTKMLPDVMEAYYTRRYIKTSIKGFFGQFSLVQVADLRRNKVITMLNFFGNKAYYVGERGEIPAGIVPLRDPEVNFTNDTLTICGMLSRRAEVTTTGSTYDIYYTETIDIKSPNITTPYYFIDYVLSDFRVQLSVLKMHLVMKKHVEKEVDISDFQVPEDYDPVSRQTMESLINSLFTKEE